MRDYTCREKILQILLGKEGGLTGGQIELMVSGYGFKPSYVARELRDMYKNGFKLERKYSQSSPHYVSYRIGDSSQ